MYEVIRVEYIKTSL